MAVLLQLLSREQIAQLSTKEWEVVSLAVDDEIQNSEKVRKLLKARVDATLKSFKKSAS